MGTEIPKMVKGREVEKIKEEWDKEDLKKIQLSAMTVNMMHYAISFNEYRKISKCKTAKEMWDKLEIIYEGNEQDKPKLISSSMNTNCLLWKKMRR